MIISRPGKVLKKNVGLKIPQKCGNVIEICYIHMLIYAV